MEELRKLGLTKYETKIYGTLLTIGKTNAKQISKHANVPPTATYPNLKSLIEKKLVQEFRGPVSEFKAISPEPALKQFIEKKQKELSALEQPLITKIRNLEKETIKQPKEILEISQGKETSRQIYFNLIKNTKQTYYILGWRLEKVADKYEFLRELKKLVKKNIDVRIILTGTKPKQIELIKDYKNEGIKIRYFPTDNFSILVKDAEECKISLKDKTLPEKYNIHILDKSLSKALNEYFLNTWEKSTEI